VSDEFTIRDYSVTTHRSVLLHIAAIPEEVIERWIDTLRMLVQELHNVGNAILSDKGTPTSRFDVRETIDDRQGVGGGVEKMPKVIVVDVPTCCILRCVVVLLFERESQ